MEQKRNKAVRKARIQNTENKKRNSPKVVNLIKDIKEHDEPPKGNPTSVCKLCGKTFDQDFYSEQNRYSNYKTCHACRKKISQKKEESIREKEVAQAVLPFSPYPWQQKAFEDFKKYRFNLWACGNRSGYNALLIK